VSKKPFFSVVIPVYNKGPHVHRAISSVLNQTFQDFELILINDASTDNSLEEMQKFTDPRIRILHRDEPGPGGYAARNLGIKEARAEWVAFLDADDEWFPEHLERMRNLADRFRGTVFLGSGWCTQTDGKVSKDAFFDRYKHSGPHVIHVKKFLELCLANHRPVCTSTACINKNSLVTDQLFPAEEKAKRGGDLHAWLKIMCRHKKMAWSDHIGAVYFQDSVNMVTKTAPSSPWLMSRKIYRELSEGLNAEEAKLLRKYLNMRLRAAWIGNLKRGNKNFDLLKRLYWQGDMTNALKLSLLALSSSFLLKSAMALKARLKNHA
jgi:glycosyltransferase involved in cell wall biosynthesis